MASHLRCSPSTPRPSASACAPLLFRKPGSAHENRQGFEFFEVRKSLNLYYKLVFRARLFRQAGELFEKSTLHKHVKDNSLEHFFATQACARLAKTIAFSVMGADSTCVAVWIFYGIFNPSICPENSGNQT